MTSRKPRNIMSSNRLRWMAAVGAAGLGGIAVALNYATRRALNNALPVVSGERVVAGMRQPVEILRDSWGIPHIYAQTEEDLFFAQGYVQAQDRLFQMDAQRRIGHGRLSEIAGPLGIPSDRLARYCGWHKAAGAQLRGIKRDPETKAMTEAFAAGVNAYITEGHLPAEYQVLACTPEPWRPIDGCAWGAVLAWGLSVNWQTELLRLQLITALGPEKAADLMPAYGQNYQTIYPNAQTGQRLGAELREAFQRTAAQLPFANLVGGSGLGSNNWVVAGRRTVSGRPMLANDPHLPPLFPALWYENHLVGGRFNVTGFTSPGVPGVIIGHNERVAWGITNGYPDIQDLYVERFHASDSLLYEVDGNWRRAQEVEEVIHVRGRRAPLVERVRHTHHGPVLSDMLAHEERPPEPYALALRWTSYEENNHLRAIIGMCRAANWATFDEATRDWGFPPQNVVYADVDGNISYVMPGLVPRRRAGAGMAPAPGWTSDSDWRGWIEHDELPHLFNPAQGYIVTANNRVTGDDDPALLNSEWLPPYRAQRIAALLESLTPLDVAQHARIQTDTVSLPVQRFVSLALDSLDEATRQSLGVDATEALTRLQDWDGDMRADTDAPSLAFGWMVCFLRAAIFQAVGEPLGRQLLDENGIAEIPTHPFHEISFELALRWLAEGAPSWVGDVRQLAPAALEQALQQLRKHRGWRKHWPTWGKLHYVELHSYISRIPAVGRLWKPLTYPLGGDSFTVNQARVAPHLPPGGAHVIASCRMILDVGAWDNSVSVLPGGQSGHPASDHYQDSVDDWLEGKYHPMLYSRERVELATENRLILRADTGEGTQA